MNNTLDILNHETTAVFDDCLFRGYPYYSGRVEQKLPKGLTFLTHRRDQKRKRR